MGRLTATRNVIVLSAASKGAWTVAKTVELLRNVDQPCRNVYRVAAALTPNSVNASERASKQQSCVSALLTLLLNFAARTGKPAPRPVLIDRNISTNKREQSSRSKFENLDIIKCKCVEIVSFH